MDFGNPVELDLKAVVHLDRDADEVFDELHHPETLVDCVPGATLITKRDHGKFQAQIVIPVGPFNLPYRASGRIIASDAGSRTASMHLDCEPDAVLPEVRVRMTMAIDRDESGCAVDMTFNVVVSNRAGLLTHARVNPIACELMERTLRRLRLRLEETRLVPMPPAA